MPLAMPVHTKHHIPVQLLVVSIMVFIQVPSYCSVVESKPFVHKYILQSWEALSWGARGILRAMYFERTLEVTTPDVTTACVHMYTSMHMMFGLLASTYVLWALEYQSRVFYLRRMGRDASEEEYTKWDPLWLSSQIYHVAIFVLLFAICWGGLLHTFMDMDPS